MQNPSTAKAKQVPKDECGDVKTMHGWKTEIQFDTSLHLSRVTFNTSVAVLAQIKK